MPRKQKNEDQDNSPPRYNGELSRFEPSPDARHIEVRRSEDELLDHQKARNSTILPTIEHGEKYHEAGKRDVEMYIRTYNTLLRSSGEVSLRKFFAAGLSCRDVGGGDGTSATAQVVLRWQANVSGLRRQRKRYR